MENNNDIQLIKIEAVVREEMFVDVKKALTDIGVNGITAKSRRSPDSSETSP